MARESEGVRLSEGSIEGRCAPQSTRSVRDKSRVVVELRRLDCSSCPLLLLLLRLQTTQKTNTA